MRWALGFPALLLLISGCSSSRSPTPDTAENARVDFDWAESRQDAKEKWSKKLPGLVTDLDVAKSSREILLSVVPDYDRTGTIPGPQLWLMSHDGNVLWQRGLSSRVKSQAISADGDWIVVSTYDEKVTAFNHAGKVLWEIEDFCRPYLMPSAKKLFCVFDDDSKPRIAFDTIDEKGNRTHSQKIDKDLLAFAVSPNDKWIAYALTQGEVVVLTSDLKPVYKTNVGGEIVDLLFSDSPSPKLAVLYNESFKPKTVRQVRQEAVVIDPNSKTKRQIPVELFGEKIALSPDDRWLFLYSNNAAGQGLAAWDLQSPRLAAGTGLWRKHSSRHADFSSLLVANKDSVIAGFENVKVGNDMQSYLMGFDAGGKVRWKIGLTTDRGAYLYVNRFTADQNSIVIATDEGEVVQYEIK